MFDIWPGIQQLWIFLEHRSGPRSCPGVEKLLFQCHHLKRPVRVECSRTRRQLIECLDVFAGESRRGRVDCRVANLLESRDDSSPNESHPSTVPDHYKDVWSRRVEKWQQKCVPLSPASITIVDPFLSLAFGVAPFRRKSFTTWRWPEW